MSSSLRISFNPMSFGNERELDIALTELRWIKKNKGKLKNCDFQTVSEKYCFPIDFLKKGILGFSYPEDFLASKSKWFPIIYSWAVRDKQYSINLYRLQFNYHRTKFVSIIFLAIFTGISFNLGSLLQSYFNLNLWETISLAIAFILSFLGLYVELRNNLTNCKSGLDEYSAHLVEMGLEHIIARNEKFIEENYKYVLYASNILLKKLQSSTTITAIYMGTKEEVSEKAPSTIKKILKKTHLLPQKTVYLKKKKIPVFYAENPILEYRKRIKELV